jgi:hypothetical protein
MRFCACKVARYTSVHHHICNCLSFRVAREKDHVGHVTCVDHPLYLYGYGQGWILKIHVHPGGHRLQGSDEWLHQGIKIPVRGQKPLATGRYVKTGKIDLNLNFEFKKLETGIPVGITGLPIGMTGKSASAQMVKKDRKIKFFLVFFMTLLISLLCMPYV